MGYIPENTIHDLRSEMHAKLLAESAVPAYGFWEEMATGLFMMACIAAGSVIAVSRTEQALPSPQEQMHAAAPAGMTEDEKDIDDTEVNVFLCEEFCTQHVEVFVEFCAEACPDEKGTGEIEQREEAEQEIPESVRVREEIIPPSVPEVQQEEIDLFIDNGPPVQEVFVRQPHNQRGVYLTSGSTGREAKRADTFASLTSSHGNAFVFDVKGSYVYFGSNAPLAQEMGTVRPVYDLPAIIQETKNNGLYTIARFIVAKDSSLAARKPETQIKNVYTGKGLGAVWVIPGHETVLAHNREILRDVIASGVDEINFDYIRYPTEYPLRSVGLSGTEKADQIEKFLKMSRETVAELGTDTKIGISTYAILGWNFPVNFEPLGQDIARFAPLVDVISPMAYPSTFAQGAYYYPSKHPGSRMYYLVYRTLQGYKELLGEHSWKLRPWIQGYYTDEEDMQDQMTAVYDAGLCGFTVWSAQNTYGPFFQALQKLEVPEKCR